VGRQLAPVQTLGQHRPDVEILYKEIACILSTSVWTIGQYRPDAVLLWQLHVDKVQPSRLGLNMEMRGVHYGKSVAQKTVRKLNASVRTLPREIRDRLDLGLLSL
jgi:hypothetical protein